jgi:hypothetical protein
LKNNGLGIVGSMFHMGLGKNTCGSLWNSIMLLGLDFMPLDQILNVSLNGFRKQVATHHKTLTRTQMDEPSIVLDS